MVLRAVVETAEHRFESCILDKYMAWWANGKAALWNGGKCVIERLSDSEDKQCHELPKVR